MEYKNKEPEHINWAKSMKELYFPGLRDYVKNFYPLGPAWGTAVSTLPSSSSSIKAPTSSTPGSPPPPKAPLISSESVQSRPREGMSAIFAEINSGKSVTAGTSFKLSVFASFFLKLVIVGGIDFVPLFHRLEKSYR